MAAQMVEFERDDASHQNPKWKKPNDGIPILPEELIGEILSRVPVKSLLQFRSVSKSWLALISSPKFIKTHLSISANNKEYTHHRLMLQLTSDRVNCSSVCSIHCSVASILKGSVMEVSKLYYPENILSGTIPVAMGSVNGLVCFVHGGLIGSSSIKKTDVLLWNPSTRKYKKLPDLRSSLSTNHRFCSFGFGYDEFHDDYKVVSFSYSFDAGCEVKICSLKEDSWRSTHYPPPDGVRFLSRGTFLNGKVHWGNYGERNIISIDLADEKWEKFELPCCVEKDAILQVGVLGNDLCVIPHNLSFIRPQLDVWVMKEYGVKESWTKIFTFNARMWQPPLYISDKEKIWLMFKRTLLLYNLKDESKEFTELKPGPGDVGTLYVESLVSPLLQNEPRSQQE